MRVLIITDSLALPREHPELCKHEHTWPYLLKQNYEVYQLSIGGATISDLARQLDYYKLLKPDIVIVQSGIVDCAPRALKKVELEIIKRLPLFSQGVQNFIKKHNLYLRKTRKITYTQREVYRKKALQIFRFFNLAKVFFISVIPANKCYEKRVPGITKNIREYNAILKNELKDGYIDISNIPVNGIMCDHIHLKKDGHWYIYRILMSKIFNA